MPNKPISHHLPPYLHLVRPILASEYLEELEQELSLCLDEDLDQGHWFVIEILEEDEIDSKALETLLLFTVAARSYTKTQTIIITTVQNAQLFPAESTMDFAIFTDLEDLDNVLLRILGQYPAKAASEPSPSHAVAIPPFF